MNVRDTGPLRRILAAAKTAGYEIEVRVVGSRTLHDRYIIDDNEMVILGTSLNGFGKKQSFVIQAGRISAKPCWPNLIIIGILQRRGHSGSLSEISRGHKFVLEIGSGLRFCDFKARAPRSFNSTTGERERIANRRPDTSLPVKKDGYQCNR